MADLVPKTVSSVDRAARLRAEAQARREAEAARLRAEGAILPTAPSVVASTAPLKDIQVAPKTFNLLRPGVRSLGIFISRVPGSGYIFSSGKKVRFELEAIPDLGNVGVYRATTPAELSELRLMAAQPMSFITELTK